MGRFREEIFIRIRNDYNAHKPSGRGSFLYQYFLNGKMKEKCAGASPAQVDSIIKKAATDLMYNLGYPLSENAVPKDKIRSHNTALDIIDAWYSMQGDCMMIAAGGGTEDFDPETYQKLYDFLNTTGKTSVLIPVRLDQETGMGIYIVGKDHYTEFPYEDPKQACGIGLLTDWFSDYEFSPEERQDELRLALAVGTMEEPADYPNMEEANKWYTRLYGRDEDRYGFFRECNGTAPDGLPEQFKRYFEAEEGDEFDHITDEELEQTKMEFEGIRVAKKRGD